MTKLRIHYSDNINYYLLVSQDCNLRCEFCYQPSSFHIPKLMTMETAEKAMKFAFNNFPEEKLRFLFYGGEPLLNFPVIKYIVEKYQQFNYVIVTNGILITDKIKEFIINNKHCLHISVSLLNAKDQYPDWKDKLKNAIEVLRVMKDTSSDVHAVFINPEEIYDLYCWMEEQDIGFIRLSTPRFGRPLQYDKYLEQYKKVADRVYFSPKGFRTGLVNFDRTFGENKGPLYCGAGKLYLMVSPDGEIYPCDYLCGLKTLKLGDIYNGLYEKDNIEKINKMQKDPTNTLYTHCDEYRKLGICKIPTLEKCHRAQCLGENLEYCHELEKPTYNHCRVNNIEYELSNYIEKTKEIK